MLMREWDTHFIHINPTFLFCFSCFFYRTISPKRTPCIRIWNVLHTWNETERKDKCLTSCCITFLLIYVHVFVLYVYLIYMCCAHIIFLFNILQRLLYFNILTILHYIKNGRKKPSCFECEFILYYIWDRMRRVWVVGLPKLCVCIHKYVWNRPYIAHHSERILFAIHTDSCMFVWVFSLVFAWVLSFLRYE